MSEITVGKPRSTRRGDPWGRHGTDLEYFDTPRGLRAQPVCTCGWRGRAYIDMNDASRATDDHDAQMYKARTGRWEE